MPKYISKQNKKINFTGGSMPSIKINSNSINSNSVNDYSYNPSKLHPSNYYKRAINSRKVYTNTGKKIRSLKNKLSKTPMSENKLKLYKSQSLTDRELFFEKNMSEHATMKDIEFIIFVKELFPTITLNNFYNKIDRDCETYNMNLENPKCISYDDEWSKPELIFDPQINHKRISDEKLDYLKDGDGFLRKSRYISSTQNYFNNLKNANYKFNLVKYNSDGDTKTISINLDIEPAHTFEYFLITTRCAPSLIKNFYNMVYLNNDIFVNSNKNYMIYDCENLMAQPKYRPLRGITKDKTIFNDYNFFHDDNTLKIYIIKNYKSFDNIRKEYNIDECYTYDIFDDIRGERDDKIEYINVKNKDLKNKYQDLKNKISSYSGNKDNVKTHYLEISDVVNAHSTGNQDLPNKYTPAIENINITKEDRLLNLTDDLPYGNMNVLVRRNPNGLVESIMVSIPSFKYPRGSFVSHGLDDVLIIFIKKL